MTARPRSIISCLAWICGTILILAAGMMPVEAMAPLAADFSAEPPQGPAQEPVRFTDASSGSPVAWYWNFGDGTTSAERSPVHSYGYLGVYTVTLTVTDSSGRNATTTKEVYIADSGTPVPETMVLTVTPQQPAGTPASPAGPGVIIALCMIILVFRH